MTFIRISLNWFAMRQKKKTFLGKPIQKIVKILNVLAQSS